MTSPDTSLRKDNFSCALIEVVTSTRVRIGHIWDGTRNMCYIADVGCILADGNTCLWADIVVHTQTAGDIVKTCVLLSPYRLLYKDKFFYTEEKTVLKMNADIDFGLHTE